MIDTYFKQNETVHILTRITFTTVLRSIYPYAYSIMATHQIHGYKKSHTHTLQIYN